MNYGASPNDSRGMRLMSAYNHWGPVQTIGERSQGHNSAVTDNEGRSFVVYHTKFNNGTVGHQVRIHQLFTNKNGWLVAAPFHFNGEEQNDESLASGCQWDRSMLLGDYRLLIHTTKQDFDKMEEATPITITLNDNREFTARVIGLDADTDLALLKIDGEDLPTLAIGDSDALKVGEWVLAVGNPFNLTSTVTAGIVSAKARNLGANRSGIESFIQTDAAINQGNSGGALVNVRGELVGINAMLYSQTGSYSGYGFAIPTTIVKKVVSDLKAYGTVQRAMLGISGMTLHDYVEAQKAKDDKFKADFGTIDGVYVAEVTEDGAAKQAGIKDGDIIVSVDGKKVTKMSELQEATTHYSPGDKAQIGIIRDKKQMSQTVTFRNAKGNTNVVKSVNIDILGAEFKELTESQQKSLNLSSGVQVTSIKDGKLRDAGIPKDFIIRKCNGMNIKTVKDLEQVFKSAQSSEDQTLWIWGQTPAGKQMSFAVQLGE